MGALTQFDCTACGKTLKSPKPIEEGTKIKCPKCMQVFVVSNGAGGGVRRSGGDLSTATTRRPTRTEKRKGSRGLAMWGTCFAVAFIFSLIVWVPCSIMIRMGQSAAADFDKKSKEMQKDPFKDLDKQLKDMKDMPKDFGKDLPKDMMKDLGKDMNKDFGKDFGNK